jgi:WD40 repeat protein
MPIQSFIATLINNCLFVVSGGGEGMIRTWSFNNGVFNHLLALEGHIRGVTSLAFVGTPQ